jgi:hypothetical protein
MSDMRPNLDRLKGVGAVLKPVFRSSGYERGRNDCIWDFAVVPKRRVQRQVLHQNPTLKRRQIGRGQRLQLG